MNEKLKEIFELLESEVILLNARWLYYKMLYDKGEKRTNLLDSSASSFFYHLQLILMDDIELFICKLLDSAKTKDYENMTLEQLLYKIDDIILQEKLKNLLCVLQRKAAIIRRKRNKRLSHFDLDVFINRPINLFSRPSHLDIEEILKDINGFLNLIEKRYNNSVTNYDRFSTKGDAESLINCLIKSYAYDILENLGKIESGFWKTIETLSNA